MTYRFDTRAVHGGQPNDPATGAVAVPIHQTATFAQDEPSVHRGFAYARSENPTCLALERNLAQAQARARVIRQVATATRERGALSLRVGPVELPRDHPLARVRREHMAARSPMGGIIRPVARRDRAAAASPRGSLQSSPGPIPS